MSVAHGPPRAMSSRLELAPMSPFLDILLDYRLYVSYGAKISLIEGRIPDAICNVERVRCFRAGSQTSPISELRR